MLGTEGDFIKLMQNKKLKLKSEKYVWVIVGGFVRDGGKLYT